MNLALWRVLVTPTGTSKLLKIWIIKSNIPFSQHLRLDIILIPLAFGWDLDSVALGDDADITLEIALHAPTDIIRVGQQGPFVVELVVWNTELVQG